MTKHFLQFAASLMLVFSANTCFAHTGGHDVNGFFSGFAHPFLGVDHLLVMLGTGLWCSRLSKLNAGFCIGSFLGFMLLGALLALAGLNIENVETVIIASVLIIGVLLSVVRQLPTLLTAALLVCFALLHGFAHGLEMPLMVASGHYALGFLTATALLNGLGLGLGAILHKHRFGLPVCGYLTSALGCWLLFA